MLLLLNDIACYGEAIIMRGREQTIEKIVGYVRETHLANSSVELPMDTSLIEAGIIDSFALIDLIAFLETEFRIQIPDEDITKPNLGSIHKMADYIIRRSQSKERTSDVHW